MEKIKRFSPFLFLLIPIIAIYRAWFGAGILSGGDVGIVFHSMYGNNYLYPYAWYWNQGVGIGGNTTALLFIYLDFALAQNFLGQILHLPWNIIERLAYFFPFLLLGLISSFVLAKKIFPKNLFLIFSPFIFLCNTYILMVVGGGQLWIFLSYAIAPLVLYFFMHEIDQIIDSGKAYSKKSFFIGLLFSFQALLDLRVAYITIAAAFLYWLFKMLQKRTLKDIITSLLFVFIIPGIITLLLHAFWILPTFIIGQNPLQQFGSAYTSISAVTYFSFAKFENTVSLLHPNWWENIFGKIGFMRPEFLLVPILSFSSLFFVSKKHKESVYILFFAFLGLVGAFLAKGANDPFGAVYIWLFDHIPGFIMFRDPTKWYLLVAIAYSILIPFSSWKIYELIKLKTKNVKLKNKITNLQNFFIFLIICYLLFLIRPALFGQVGGTLKTTQIPNEYVHLESFISSQHSFFRTFWFPTIQRFGINSKDHPAISGRDFLTTYTLTIKANTLSDASVKYVIVPYDSEGEIFVNDRKYDNNQYMETVKKMQQISGLHRVEGFGKLAIFEVSSPKSHFWSPEKDLIIRYKNVNPTKYELTVRNAKKGDTLVFADSFDSKWIARSALNDQDTISSTKFDGFLNSFVLEKTGSYVLEVYYSPQKYVDIGLVISIVTFITIGISILLTKMIK